MSAALAALLTTEPDMVDRDELAALVRHVRTVRGFVDAADVRLARRGRQLADEGAAESPFAMLLDEGRRSGREARATQEREQLCDRMPGFEDALAAGAVSTDHLDVLSRAAKGLNDAERADLHAAAGELVDAASSEYVSVFERRCKGLIGRIRDAHRPGRDADELDRQRADSKISRWVDKASGMHKTLIELDPLRDASLWSAIDAQLATLKQADGNAGVPYPQLQVDALLAAVSAGEPCRRVPEVGVLVDWPTLRDGLHARSVCETEAGISLPVSAVRRLCCDADVFPVVLGGDGEALDVGRSVRTANRAQRRALRAMHRTCAHPHCTVGVDRCRIHHLRPWIDGGTTNLPNLVPLCEQHHHLVHEGRWTLTMTHERIATWARPDGTVWHTGPATDRRPSTRHGEARHGEARHGEARHGEARHREAARC